MDVVTVGRAE